MANGSLSSRRRKVTVNIGDRYGKLTVVRYSHHRDDAGDFWWCRCDCGGEKAIRGTLLPSGRTVSCGCVGRQRLTEWRDKYDNAYVDQGDGTTKLLISLKSDGTVVGTVLLNTADLTIVQSHRWYIRNGYARTQVDGLPVPMHHMIAGKWVDHRDRNRANNTRENLRPATARQNAYNRPKKRTSPHRFKGIRRAGDKWAATVKVDGKYVCVGIFPTDEDAARAYDAAARKHYGEFACCNFPGNP